MQPASFAPDTYQDLLTRLPPDLDLDVLARSTKAIQCNRRLGDGASLLRLALALRGLPALSDPA